MAAAGMPLAACPCWSAAPQIHEQQRVRLSTARARASFGSGFRGQLELRGAAVVGRGLLGGGRDPRLRRRRGGVARAGLPVVSSIPVLGPVVNAFLNPVVLFILYAAGASRFWSGFERTSYSSSAPTKVALTALWPALFIASAAFRSNFKRAVK